MALAPQRPRREPSRNRFLHRAAARAGFAGQTRRMWRAGPVQLAGAGCNLPVVRDASGAVSPRPDDFRCARGARSASPRGRGCWTNAKARQSAFSRRAVLQRTQAQMEGAVSKICRARFKNTVEIAKRCQPEPGCSASRKLARFFRRADRRRPAAPRWPTTSASPVARRAWMPGCCSAISR